MYINGETRSANMENETRCEDKWIEGRRAKDGDETNKQGNQRADHNLKNRCVNMAIEVRRRGEITNETLEEKVASDMNFEGETAAAAAAVAAACLGMPCTVTKTKRMNTIKNLGMFVVQLPR